MNELNPAKIKSAVEYIDSWLDFNFRNSRLPGLQVAIQHEDKLVYSKAFGYADIEKKEKFTTNHGVRIASQSKTFTATAIMQLQEAGKLHLDDRVSQYVKWFKSSKDKRVSEVTIKHLLNHTAGVIRDGEDADYWQVLREFPSAAELKEYISTASLIYDSDEKFKYSNFGFGYLGQVIEAISGVSYGEYVTENIIEKLGLKSTGFDLDDKANNMLATGYGLELLRRDRKAFKHIHTGALASATGFYSTAEDVCKYFAAHFFGNSQLLSDLSKRAMQHGYWEAESGMESYGLGMIDHMKKGWNLHGHDGGFPGFTTKTKFDPKRQLVVTVFANNLGGPTEKIINSMIGIIDTFQQNASSDEKSTSDLKKFTGRFYSKWGPTDIVLAGNKLLSVEPSNWNDFERSEELSPIDEVTLKIKKASGYSSPGETVKYTFDENGKIKKVVDAGFTLMSWEDAQKTGWF